MRGDCLVKLGDSRTALKAFTQAEASDDTETSLKAHAGVVILQSCRGLSYMPRGVEPIDVTTNQGWSQAAGAIFDVKYRASQKEIKAAETAQEMAPIISVVPTITDLTALNLVAGGDSGQFAASFRSIGQRARDIISRELAKQDRIIAQIEQRADTIVQTSHSWGYGWSIDIRAGLGTNERDALNQVVAVAQQANTLAVDGKQMANILGGDEPSWQAVIDAAFGTADRAQSVLDAE